MDPRTRRPDGSHCGIRGRARLHRTPQYCKAQRSTRNRPRERSLPILPQPHNHRPFRMTPTPARAPLLPATTGFLPALACALLALVPLPILQTPALLLANALAMAAAVQVLDHAPAPWRASTLRQLPAHLVRFAMACALLFVLTLWPLLQLRRAPTAAAWILLAGSLLLWMLALWPFWTRLAEVFADARGTPQDMGLGEVIAARFRRRGASAPRQALPALLALLALCAGVLALGGLPPVADAPVALRAALLSAYALLVLPAATLLLASRARTSAAAETAADAARDTTAAAEPGADAAADAGAPPVAAIATAAPPPPADAATLLEAARHGEIETALALLAAGVPADAAAPPGTTDQRSALALAAVLPDTRLLRALIAHGAEVNRLRGGMTALHAATRDSWHGRDEAVLALLANGADPRLRDSEGRTALHGAALSGNPNIAAMLLDAGVPVDAPDAQGMSALALACRAGNWTLAVFLLEHGASAQPADGEPPLVAACSIGEDDIAGARLLLKHRAKVNACDRLGRSALMAAALEGHAALAHLLLAAGADVRAADRHGTTALMEAARAGSAALIEALGEAGADALAQDAHGRDALMLACQSPRSDAAVVRALLALGADPLRRGADGRSALDHASAAGRWDLVAALAPDRPLPANLRGLAQPAAGADAPADLLEALRGEHWGVASSFESAFLQWPQGTRAGLYLQLGAAGHDLARRWLAEHGVDGELRLEDGMRLFDALVARLPDTLEALEDLSGAGASPAGGGLLARALVHLVPAPEGAALTAAWLERGADAFGASPDGRVPLGLAAAAGWQAAAEALLTRGADPNARDARARTPLHHALALPATDALPLVRALVRAGADPLAANDSGETPLGLALARGDAALIDWLRWDGGWPLPGRPLRPEDIAAAAAAGDAAAVRRLLALGFAVDQPDAEGYRALLHACGRGHAAVAQLLLDAGARIDALSASGVSALAAAVNGRRTALVDLLLQRGAPLGQTLAGGAQVLMLAAARGNAAQLEQLLAAGADANAASTHGQTALLALARFAFDQRDSLAARRGFELLLRHGAHVNQTDDRGTSALLLLLGAHAPPGQDGDATHIGALLPLLLDHGAEAAHADQRGVTALHCCALHALLGPARLLIQRGAPLQARDAWGRTPAQVAQKLGYSDLALELEARAAPGVRQTLLRPAADD